METTQCRYVASRRTWNATGDAGTPTNSRHAMLVEKETIRGRNGGMFRVYIYIYTKWEHEFVDTIDTLDDDGVCMI